MFVETHEDKAPACLYITGRHREVAAILAQLCFPRSLHLSLSPPPPPLSMCLFISFSSSVWFKAPFSVPAGDRARGLLSSCPAPG